MKSSFGERVGPVQMFIPIEETGLEGVERTLRTIASVSSYLPLIRKITKSASSDHPDRLSLPEIG